MKIEAGFVIALISAIFANEAIAGGPSSGRSTGTRSSSGYSTKSTPSSSYGARSADFGKGYSLPSYSPRNAGTSTKVYTPPGVQNYKSTSVRPYVKRNGTVVGPAFRSTPNRSINDNWSTKGNYNPFTGKKGAQRLMEPGEMRKR